MSQFSSKKPIKVLMITGSYPPMMCGVGDYACALVNSLRAQGVDVRVLTSQIKDSQNSHETWIKRIIPNWRVKSYKVLIDELEDFVPDIVHIQDPTQGYDFATAPALMVAMASLRRKMNIVWTWHEFVPKKLNKRFMAFHVMAFLSNAIAYVRHNYKNPKSISLFLHKKPFQFIPNASVIPKVDMDSQERDALRRKITEDGRQIIVFFGFIYPNKGVERLFEIANPNKHHIVLIGKFDSNYDYHQKILALSKSPNWANHVTFLGFQSSENVARYIQTADAVVLPYLEGAGSWNTSLHAAILQGSFVLTTSMTQSGYDKENNIFYATPDDVQSMKESLLQYCGVRKDVTAVENPWVKIAKDHIELYNQILLSRK